MDMNEYAAIFSDEGLIGLHKSVRAAFDKDEATPEEQEKIYGVREYSDWRQWSDALESEMTKRGVNFEPVPW